jgi:hypothetical protein
LATLGEFGSLLQLGVGFGIGLSLFRAPMELLKDRLRNDLAAEFDVLSRIPTPRALQSKAELSDLKGKIENNTIKLDQLHLPFMIAAILGAVVNWLVLILASLDATRPLSNFEVAALIFCSVAWYLLIGVILAGFAFYQLYPLSRELTAIRMK